MDLRATLDVGETLKKLGVKHAEHISRGPAEVPRYPAHEGPKVALITAADRRRALKHGNLYYALTVYARGCALEIIDLLKAHGLKADQDLDGDERNVLIMNTRKSHWDGWSNAIQELGGLKEEATGINAGELVEVTPPVEMPPNPLRNALDTLLAEKPREKRVQTPSWQEQVVEAMQEALRALDDAASVVEPGEDEERAYEREMEGLKAALKLMGATPCF